MKNVTFFAAAFVSTAFIATPALAQSSQPKTGDQVKAKTEMKTPKAKKMHTSHMRHHPRHHARMQRQAPAYRESADNGFWPGQVVGGAIGTAGAIAATTVGTAGAIAAAPFEGPYRGQTVDYRYGGSYAYAGEPGWDSGYYGTYNYSGNPIANSPNYDARNGFACRPGTITKIGNDRVICQ